MSDRIVDGRFDGLRLKSALASFDLDPPPLPLEVVLRT
jgi:hypothetical protein